MRSGAQPAHRLDNTGTPQGHLFPSQHVAATHALSHILSPSQNPAPPYNNAYPPFQPPSLRLFDSPDHPSPQYTERSKKMAATATSAALSLTRAKLTVPSPSGRTRRTQAPVRNVNKMISLAGGVQPYVGLRPYNELMTVGAPVSAHLAFAIAATGSSSRGRRGTRGGGGALSASCSAAAEIFRIAAVMNGLVLVGVAVGFVLLRIEASVEEAE